MYHTLHISTDTWRLSVLQISLPILPLLRNHLPVYSPSKRSSTGISNAKKAILSSSLCLSLCCLSVSLLFFFFSLHVLCVCVSRSWSSLMQIHSVASMFKSLAPQRWDYNHRLPCPAFWLGYWGNQLGSSCLLSKQYTDWNFFLVLHTRFLKVSVLCDWWPVDW